MFRLGKATVYLAGKMTGLSIDKMSEWRNITYKRLDEAENEKFFDQEVKEAEQ